MVKSDGIKNNQAIQNILNKTFRQLYEEYINSDEFKEEIGRLNSKHKNEEFYLRRYAYLAKTFVRFYSK